MRVHQQLMTSLIPDEKFMIKYRLSASRAGVRSLRGHLPFIKGHKGIEQKWSWESEGSRASRPETKKGLPLVLCVWESAYCTYSDSSSLRGKADLCKDITGTERMWHKSAPFLCPRGSHDGWVRLLFLSVMANKGLTTLWCGERETFRLLFVPGLLTSFCSCWSKYSWRFVNAFSHFLRSLSKSRSWK